MYCNEKILNILENEDYEEGMPIQMYNCTEKNDEDSKNIMPNDDGNNVASKTEIAMNLALDEQSVNTWHEQFDNYEEDNEFSDNQIHLSTHFNSQDISLF